ncbi:MFS transporter [Sporolactobacillus terrae]|uniref:MFS transporter n=1 Tax=Sporolactobacillus terrae TaxID=269673 RepID=UPI0004913435|nr:MFS transporter [Sporolactobacillus terrae]
MNRFINIFRNKNYRNLFFASFASQLGTVTSATAFTFYFLDHYGSKPSYATIAEMMYTLPSVFVFFIVGVLADNRNQKKITMYSDCLNACLCLFLLFAVRLNTVYAIFPILFMITATSKFFTPAQIGLIQGILSNADYAVAGGLNQMLTSIFLLFGTAFGAFFYLQFGISGAILINCVSFLISAFLIFHCQFDPDTVLPKSASNKSGVSLSFVFSEFKQGCVYILHHRLLKYLMIGTFILGFVNGGLSIMPVYLLKYKLAADHYQQAASVSGIMLGIGILTGSFIASLLANKMKLYKLMIFGFFLASICLSIEFFAENVLFFLTFYFLTGFSIPIVSVPFYGWLPQIVNSAFMGRVQALLDPVGNFAQFLLFVILAFTFPKYISVEIPFLWLGGCLLAVGILYKIILPKAEKALTVK